MASVRDSVASSLQRSSGIGYVFHCKRSSIYSSRGSAQNIDAEFVSLENVVPLSESENFSDSETLGQDFYDRVAEVVAERIKQCGNRVPVVTGELPQTLTYVI